MNYNNCNKLLSPFWFVALLAVAVLTIDLSKQSVQDRYVTDITVVSCSNLQAALAYSAGVESSIGVKSGTATYRVVRSTLAHIPPSFDLCAS